MQIALILSVVILAISYIAMALRFKRMSEIQNQTISDLTESLYNESKKPKTVTYSFGKMDKYTDDDLNLMRSNPQLLETLMKILGNFTILRNDSLRDPSNKDRISEVI